ncbi:hypothetical protein HUT18_11810 [Streptomyces sp. NA04227]|uniref:hypothetical protein n=1 Tax=Streptomyces sp. NA04227 TaxID=2742136 RepID=UPI001590F9AF|nr:hypothetical protein [Streptomyces sp. NA04227]QKW06984.1 hypothetical protein HUT18_11810 [Streptomyces sp. NA04227]
MPENPDAPQYQEPGVKYRRVKKQRQVVTVIDGRESTHTEGYYVQEPVPPKDWETVVLRGVIGLAVFLTVAAFIGTSASVGGLLAELLHPFVAYLIGLVFTASWLGCLALEWLDGRIDPDRARPARIAGWVALVIGMGAVFVYGYSNGLPWVGAVGAVVDLLSKGFWALLLRRTQVKLSKGVTNWVVAQEQEAAGRALLGEKLRRLYRGEAYRRAVGGPEYQTAQALMTAPAAALTAPAQPGQRPDGSAPASGQTPAEPAPEPALPAQTTAAGQSSGTVSAQATTPPGPLVPLASGQDTDNGADMSGGQGNEDAVRDFAVPSIAAMAREALDQNPHMDKDDPAFLARVHKVHPKAAADTVRRTVHREIQRRKRTAS